MKTLIFGFDLSFNSTGITIAYLEDNVGKKIRFYNIVFDDGKSKTGKVLVPRELINVNIITYRMPTNILTDDLLIEQFDLNTFEQCNLTLKATICSKKIESIILENIEHFEPDMVVGCFENYVMPSYTGATQLKNVSGLITLQGYVRRDLIYACLRAKFKIKDIKIDTPTPSQNKFDFCGDGKAEKPDMVKAFLEHYQGNKLLPVFNSVHQINDIVDSFALMINGYGKIINNL